MTSGNGDDSSLDYVLTEVGAFGQFQVYAFLMLSTVKILSALSVTNYIMSANTMDYRCLIPECDVGSNPRDIQFKQPWLENAIPHSDGKIESCYRYAPRNMNGTFSGQCSEDMFDTSVRIACSSFVHASDERNVQTEFNIHCGESYKLALIGTVGNIGRFIFLPIAGILSDKFGRLPGIVFGTVLSNLFAVIKSFSVDYYMYATFEFLEACANSCAFSGIFVLAVELVNSKYRVLGSSIISLASPIGEMLLGLVAMHVHDFRTYIRILHTPGLLVFVYFWLLPESIRWLLVTGRVDRAINTFKKIAKVNGKQLSTKSIEIITQQYMAETKRKSIEEANDKNQKSDSVFQLLCLIIKSRTLIFRFLICSYQWIACTFSYYGLSMSSTQIQGTDRYLSYILIMGSAIPGVFLSKPMLNRMKRRHMMLILMLVSAISITSTPFIPKEYPMIVILSFVVGKASIACAFVVLYVYTAEQWPTSIRNTAHNTCSMIGRVGSMVAPFAVVLAGQNTSIPSFLYGGSACIAAVSVLFSPETFLKKLPDTIDEAENL